MRGLSWWLAVTALGLVGTAVAVLAGLGATPGASVVISLGLVPLSVLALAFMGLAKTSAVAAYVVVTIVALGAPIADLWSRSIAAGNADDSTWLGLTCGTAITLAGAAATLLASTRTRDPHRNAATTASA